MKEDRRKPRLEFVIAEDKVEAFLNNRTVTLEESIKKSKEHRKRLLARAKHYQGK